MTTHPTFNRCLWGTMLGLPLLVWVALHAAACSQNPPPVGPDATACLEAGIAAMVDARSCLGALQGLQDVVRRYPSCAAALTPIGSAATAIEIGGVTMLCETADGGGQG